MKNEVSLGIGLMLKLGANEVQQVAIFMGCMYQIISVSGEAISYLILGSFHPFFIDSYTGIQSLDSTVSSRLLLYVPGYIEFILLPKVRSS